MNSLIRERKAYAKINLHLEVLNKREDGYHNILGLFCSINLFDLLKLIKAEIVDSPRGVMEILVSPIDGPFGDAVREIPPSENIVWKAARRYFEGTGKTGTLMFSLRKNIPSGAGLGGGSTDAAAVLKLLNEEFSLKSNDELMRIAHTLGADVPYCMTGGTALCEGIGEIVDTFPCTLRYSLLLVNDGIEVNTGGAYRALDRQGIGTYSRAEAGNIKKRIKETLCSGKIEDFRHVFRNDFEKKVFELYPEIGRIKCELDEHGSDFTIMTGSGSTVIGLFKSEHDARQAHENLKKKAKFTYLAEFINQV